MTASEQNSPIHTTQTWSPPMRQTSVEAGAVPAHIPEFANGSSLQTYVDQYGGYSQYNSYYESSAYMSQQQQQQLMYNEQMVAVPEPHHHQQHHHHQNLESQFYAPLDQYSRVQSVGDLKMASRAELEMSRQGISMSQPDLSTASWNNETKYQVL